METFFPDRVRAAVLILAGALAASSCQTIVTPPPDHFQNQTITGEFLIQHLANRQAEVNDLKSFLRTTVQGSRGRHSFQQVLLVRQKDSVRIDTFGVLGQTLGIFIHESGEALLYDAGKNEVIRGQRVWSVMSRMLGTSLDFRKNISVFIGNIPNLEQLRNLEARLGPEKKFYHLKALDPEQNDRVDITVDAYTLLPVRMTLIRRNQETITVDWQDYRKIGGRDFPHLLVFSVPGRDEKVTVRYKDPQLNEGVPADAFRLSLSGLSHSSRSVTEAP